MAIHLVEVIYHVCRSSLIIVGFASQRVGLNTVNATCIQTVKVLHFGRYKTQNRNSKY